MTIVLGYDGSHSARAPRSARPPAHGLAVVGGSSRGPVACALLGSVVLNLVQSSPVPLLVVPE